MIRIALEDIKRGIEEVVGEKDISIKSKAQDLPIWRGIYCKIACTYTPHTLRRIASLINITHGNVVYWRDTFEYYFPTRPDVEKRYNEVLERLGLFAAERFQKEVDAENELILKSMLSENRE